MKELISASINTLTDFLNGIETKIKQINSNSVLASVYLPVDNFQLKNKIDRLIKLFERSFYLEKPAESFSLLGLDEALAISENGDSRFAATDKKIKELKKIFINNFEHLPDKNLPLFIGGFKFTTERMESDWQDYNDSIWFVPEIMFLSNSGRNFLFMNFLFSTGTPKETIIKRFKTKLEKIIETEVPNKNFSTPRILKDEGTSPKDKKKWKNLVSEALEKIKENQITKVVLSRKVELTLSEEPDLDCIIDKLGKDYPECYVFVFHRGKSSFFGATPEKLARLSKGKIEIDILAGSAPRGKNNEEDLVIEQNLLKDEKNLNEHNIVIDHVRNSISRITSNLNLETHCGIKKLANIQHIWSKISAELNGSASIFLVLKELYPTPAICGLPKDTALHIIKKIEGYKRGLYSGVIGWFNLNDEAEFAVALRSALSVNNKITAYAGGGIVENSVPDDEYKETELKLKTIMSLFTNENKN